MNKLCKINCAVTEITVLEGKLSKAREVKQGMMSVLLTRKIRLNHDQQDERIAMISKSDMDAEVSALEAKLSTARQVKAGMMSVLLSGRVRLV